MVRRNFEFKMNYLGVKNIFWVTFFVTIFFSGQNQAQNNTSFSQINGILNGTGIQSEIWHETRKLRTHEASLNWIVDKTYFDIEGKDHFIESPTFSAPTNDDFKWYIRIEPNNGTQANHDIMKIWLSPESKNGTVRAKFGVYLWNEEGKKYLLWGDSIMSAKCAHPNSSSTQCVRGWSLTFSRRTNNFANNEMRITCNITFCEDFSSIPYQSYQMIHQPAITENNFTENLVLTELYKKLDFADVVFLVNGTEYRAHKGILAARSPRFAAMFKRGTEKGKKMKRVNIADIEAPIFGQMLRYIYTGKCEHLDQLADCLLLAAIKYELRGLKTMCLNVLMTGLTIENVADRLLFADKNGIEELKSHSIRFIGEKYTKVSNSSNWKSVAKTKPQLVHEVCQFLSNANYNGGEV